MAATSKTSFMKLEIEVTSNLAAYANELKNFRARDINRVMRRSMEYALTPVVKAAKAGAPSRSRLKKGKTIRQRTGLTKKAIGKVIRTYADKHITVGRVGAIKSTHGPEPGSPKNRPIRRPASYFHLLERGFAHKRGDKTVIVPGMFFLRKAYYSTRQEVNRRMVEGIRRQIDIINKKVAGQKTKKRIAI